MTAEFHVGDALAVLPILKPGSVDLVVTSPPFLALRSYLPADHPAKALEHGSEATPAAFLATLLDVTAELDRVLAPHGSLCVELGDTYSGAGGYGNPDSPNPAYGKGDRFRERWEGRTEKRFKRKDDGWPESKSLCLIPSLYAASLAYGRNLLAQPPAAVEALAIIDGAVARGMTAEEAIEHLRAWMAASDGASVREFEPWRVRNLVAWVRPNPPVGALGDKFRPATSYITIATRARDRWWDDIPTRRPSPHVNDDPTKKGAREFDRGDKERKGTERTTMVHPAGAPLLDWWEITPTGFTSNVGQHYATFPPALVEPLVEAMCPRRVCTACGQPSRRIVETTGYVDNAGKPANRDMDRAKWRKPDELVRHFETQGDNTAIAQRETVGWSTCGCPGADGIRDDGYHTGPAWRPGLVLDPYAGTFTVGEVATGHARDAVGIDLNPANVLLAEERLGMFLTVVEPAEVEGAA